MEGTKFVSGGEIMNMQLKGVYSALFTIYDQELNIKKNAVHKLMNYHQENGLQGFYVGGNSGEGMVLPVKTRMDMLETVMEEKKDSTIRIKAGFVEGKAIDAAGVIALAELPSREALVAQVLGTMLAPLTGLANVLNANIRGLAVALQAIVDKKSEPAA
jgi:hypothetical protein